MKKKILPVLRSGLILNMSTNSFIGGLIRRVLAHDWEDRRECSNHDSIVVKAGGVLWIGESVFPRAKLISIEDFEERVRSGYIYRLRVLEVAGATRTQERKAAKWWLDHVLGLPYDWYAFPRLLFKALCGDWIKSAAGMRWAWFCTEGIHEAYKSVGLNPWVKHHNATPLTTLHRWQEGLLNLVGQ